MIDYDFSTLNDKEFENLSIDLLSKMKHKRFERFKSGKDGGIDGRFYHSNGTQEIVQCKHYLKTGFKGLISSLKKKNDKGINEIDKVDSLSLSKYFFITSLPLSPDNNKTIKELFTPHIKDDNDIYGQEDLNQILADNPDIEERYYKLWLSSRVVLDRIYNNAIESRSEFLLEDIKENAKYYVVTENHNKAIEKLENSHIIIIAGEPGIGKTTLAEHISLWYVEKDFKFYNIENSINEAESIYKRDEKQIFYFDDFLGANYLNAIEDKKDSHIVKFMDRIKRDKTKRFILTSRTNIFNQGLALSDTFKSKNIMNEEFIIKIDSLKDIDKAMIFYNHIWHSDLDEEFIDEIYIDKRYKKIINHKNFNSRLIGFITDIQKIKNEDIKFKDYWNYIKGKMDNPQDIWKNTFDKQSDEFGRVIVILVVCNGNRIDEEDLIDAYDKYIELTELQNNSNTSKDFESVIAITLKYFLNKNKNFRNVIEYTIFNPSIADFIINRYKNNIKIFQNSYRALSSIESLRVLQNLSTIIDKEKYENIILSLYKNISINPFKDVDYSIRLLCIKESIAIKSNGKNSLEIDKFLQDIIDRKIEFYSGGEFMSLMTFVELKNLNIQNRDFIFILINNGELHEDYANEVIKLINYWNIFDTKIICKLNEFVNGCLEESLSECINTLVDDNNEEEWSFFLEEGIEGYLCASLNANSHLKCNV